MVIDILTIFPQMIEAVAQTSILGRAREAGLVSINAVDIRAFSLCKHKNTDDYPFGGGAGMLMLAQPIADAMRSVTKQGESALRVYLSPRGERFTQETAQKLSQYAHLVLLCGHYEGVDERAVEKYVDMEISLGDFVLTGGELAALAVADCVSRLIPGVLGSQASPLDESFAGDGLLEYPQYTRPRVFEGMEVPEVLLSGDHAKIAAWRREQALLVTLKRRPELLESASLTQKERAWLDAQRKTD